MGKGLLLLVGQVAFGFLFEHLQHIDIVFCQRKVGFAFLTLLDLDETQRKAVMPEFKKANPQGSFPTVVINGRVILGNDSKAILEALYL